MARPLFNDTPEILDPTRRFNAAKGGIKETHPTTHSPPSISVHCAASQSTVLTTHIHESTVIYHNIITTQSHGVRNAVVRFDNPASPSTFHGFKDSKSLQAAADLYAPNLNFSTSFRLASLNVLKAQHSITSSEDCGGGERK